jgi:hypothetical protein
VSLYWMVKVYEKSSERLYIKSGNLMGGRVEALKLCGYVHPT